MHDPYTKVFKIPNIFVKVQRFSKSKYRPALITVWHKDPDRHGDDDSCGRFIRSRHMDKELLEKIRKSFEFEYQYWFDLHTGEPKLGPISLAIQMFSNAAWKTMWHENDEECPKGDPLKKFMNKHLYEIIQFADNPHDSLIRLTKGIDYPNRYGYPKSQRIIQEHIDDAVSIVAPYIARMRRPWYKHPRWHVHHWRIQWNFLQGFWARHFKKCSICGARGNKPAGSKMFSSWCTDRDNTRSWHCACSEKHNQPPINPNAP